jgi:hypothetical protein
LQSCRTSNEASGKKRTPPTLLKPFSFDDGEVSFSVPKRRVDQTLNIDEAAERASDAIDALLSSTEKYGLTYLSSTADQVFSGLLALAANGNKKAAEVLANSLLWAVKDFETLISNDQKGKALRAWARKAVGIPGIISPNREAATHNQQLVKRLEVGKDCQFAILPTGKKGRRWKYKSPVNDLALRLCHYIDRQRALYKIHLFDEKQGRIKLPAWLHDVTRLQPFSAKTSRSWASVAWAILMDVTNGKPESDSHLRPLGESAALKKPKYCKTLRAATKASNIRAKIKSRLFEAFQTIAAR